MRRVTTSGVTRWYVYAWRGGPCVLKTIGRQAPRLNADALRCIQAARERIERPDSSTLLALIREWRSLDPSRPSSPEWEALAPSTKRTWGGALDRIEDKWGKTPLSVWNDARMVAKVVAWRDSRRDTPRGADIGVTVLRMLLEFGRLRGRVQFNAASNIPTLYRNGSRAEIVWSADDIERFATVARSTEREHLLDGLRLAVLTGLRRADLVSLTWDQVGDLAIVKRARKESAGKRRHVTIPRLPALNDLLVELRSRYRREGVNTVLVNSAGRTWTESGFGGSFNRVRDEAEIFSYDPDTGERRAKHLHDLRGTFCTKLMTLTDFSDREIAEVMGWAPDRVSTIRRIYVEDEKRVLALTKRMASVSAS